MDQNNSQSLEQILASAVAKSIALDVLDQNKPKVTKINPSIGEIDLEDNPLAQYIVSAYHELVKKDPRIKVPLYIKSPSEFRNLQERKSEGQYLVPSRWVSEYKAA